VKRRGDRAAPAVRVARTFGLHELYGCEGDVDFLWKPYTNSPNVRREAGVDIGVQQLGKPLTLRQRESGELGRQRCRRKLNADIVGRAREVNRAHDGLDPHISEVGGREQRLQLHHI
jgi:hypothetical protein